MKQRLAAAPLTVPALAGVVVALVILPTLPLLQPLFSIPGHGIGLVSITHYPKGWDYAVVGILFAVAAIVTIATAAGLGPRASGLLANRRIHG